MLVKDLIEKLSKLPQDTEVYIGYREIGYEPDRYENIINVDAVRINADITHIINDRQIHNKICHNYFNDIKIRYPEILYPENYFGGNHIKRLERDIKKIQLDENLSTIGKDKEIQKINNIIEFCKEIDNFIKTDEYKTQFEEEKKKYKEVVVLSY